MKVTVTVEMRDGSAYTQTASTGEGNPLFHGAEAEACIDAAAGYVIKAIEAVHGERPNDSVARLRRA
jgi:hypothetical protein